MLLDIVINVILYVVIFIVSLGIIILIAHLLIKKKNKFRVEIIDGKYSPMSGKRFFRIDQRTGFIIREINIGSCMKFDTPGEARVIYEAFINQRKKKKSIRPKDHPVDE